MLEGVIRQAGEARQGPGIRARPAFERDRVEIGGAPLAPIPRFLAEHRLARAAEMLEDGEHARSPAELGQQTRDRSRRRAVLGQQQEAALRRQMQSKGVERSAVQAQDCAVGNRPAEPGGGEAERARLRQDRHFVAGKMAREHGADAVPQGVAAGQHCHPAAAVRGDRADRVGQRALPYEALGGTRRHHRQMALAADQGLGGLDKGTGRCAQAGNPVFADADDREPRLHFGVPAARALTAAAANALPPRRPLRAM